jgi:hypothetical protein
MHYLSSISQLVVDELIALFKDICLVQFSNIPYQGRSEGGANGANFTIRNNFDPFK